MSKVLDLLFKLLQGVVMTPESSWKAKRHIRRLCSKMLGYNSVRQVLASKTPPGVIRTAIEAVVRQKAEDVNKEYLLDPKILSTMKIVQMCKNEVECIFSVVHNGVTETFAACLCLSSPRLSTYQSTKPIINF